MRQLWRNRRTQADPSPFDLIDFAIVDLETTGWVPEEATITEIGAVLVCGGRVRAQFSSLVNPGGAAAPAEKLSALPPTVVLRRAGSPCDYQEGIC